MPTTTTTTTDKDRLDRQVVDWLQQCLEVSTQKGHKSDENNPDAHVYKLTPKYG